MRRFLAGFAVSAVATVLLAPPAAACGGLVAANGAVELQQTTTLAAYHDGVEHYVTSFVYAGTQDNFGSIIPLPGVPTDVRRAGSWTLQRLEREVHPVPPSASFGASRVETAAPAQVLLQTTVDALDITVLSGGGDSVLEWVKAHGYAVSPDAPPMMEFYARRSPVFLAARFNAAAARARHQLAGDGTPVQITIPTPSPWVPLKILTLAKGAAAPIQADVFLLTDRAPSLLGLDSAVRVQASQPASDSLLSDLRSDKDSGWIPDQGWLTFVRIDGTAGRLGHDLAIDPSGADRPSVIQAGYSVAGAVPASHVVGLKPVTVPGRHHFILVGLGAAATLIILVGGFSVAVSRRESRRIDRARW